MTTTTIRRAALAVMLTSALGASEASAQVFGTFSWQMQPYCNVVTLTITQIPGGFTLDGNDNQCGLVGKLAGATGMALINPDGTVGLEFTIVTAPGGKAAHVSASVSTATGSGPWIDSVGNTGNFALGSPGSGSPRPLPASGIGPGVITTTELAPAAVGAAQLAANAVTGATVADGSLTMADVANGPRAAFASGDQNLPLNTTTVIARTVTLTAPSSGTVVVSASGYFEFNDTTATRETGRCSITTGPSIDFSHLVIQNDGSATTQQWEAWGATRGFAVSAGAFTVNLACNRFSGTVDVVLSDSSLTAIFVAQ